jgi:subtilase family serine protease
VVETELTTLKGNVPLLVRASDDLGPASASTQLTHMRLVLSRTPAQQAALDKYLADLQDKSSPNYHMWLTPEQFGKRYGPADSDIAAIVSWLESHGLKLEEVSAGRTNVAFSGTVSQVEEALHTSIHSFAKNGEQFLSNTMEPRIPTALASVVAGVAHLDTIRPRPQYVKGQPGFFNAASKKTEPVSSARSNRPGSELTTGNASIGYTLYIVPGDAATIYDTPNTFNANYTGTSYTGTGVTIGIAGDATINPATVASYRSRFLGDTTQPTVTNADGVTSTIDTDEAYVDTELAGGIAPGASIHFYTANDVDTAIQQAMTDNTVDIFNLSFGLCELYLTTAQNVLINGYWAQAAAQGIAVTVSTGDSGSAGCDAVIDNAGNNITEATGGLGVNGYASTPYNIAVGGTDFDALLTSYSLYAVTSMGTSTTYYRTAKSYIPEATWNDSTVSNTTISANEPLTANAALASQANILAGSGGLSNCSINTSTATTNGVCQSGYAKPAWQQGTGVPADGARDLPDVSLMSGDGFYSGTWLVCTDDAATGNNGAAITNDCTTQTDGSFYFNGFGGTSTAAPTFAGILALVQQKAGGRLGQAAKEIYDLYNGSHAGAIFHDVTVGNIAVPCTSGTPNCSKNTAGYYFESGYDTGAGYDLATGLGSVDAAQLVTYWGTATGPSAATIHVTPSATTITTTDPLTVTTSVAGLGSLGPPTGTVTLTSGTYSSGAQPLSSGGYAFSVPAGNLAIGSDTLTVTYSGDPTYASVSNNSNIIQVTGLTPTVTVTPSTTTLSSSAPLPVTVTVAGPSGDPVPGGTVTLSSGSYSSGAQQLAAGSYSFTIPANSLVAGSNTLAVSYSGDSVYVPASNNKVSVQVTQSSYALSAGSSTLTLAAGATTGNTSTISVTPASGFTGTVNLGCAVTTTLTNPTSPATCSIPSSVSVSGSAAATAALTVATTATTTAGAYTVTVTGTSGTLSQNTVVNVTVTASSTVGAYSLSATTPAAISAGTATSSTVTVTASNGYTGTVTLACALTSSPTSAASLPTCAASISTANLSSATTSGTVTFNITTTAATTAALRPGSGGGSKGWTDAGAGMVLALLVFVGIPARRRSWRALLGTVILMLAVGGLGGCKGFWDNPNQVATTSGAYTFTVTGTGNPAVTPAPTTTFTLTVN